MDQKPECYEDAIQFLYEINSTDADHRIVFEEEGHRYSIQNMEFKKAQVTSTTIEYLLPVISASKMIDQVFMPIDLDPIAQKIYNSDTFKNEKNNREYKYYGCNSVEDIKNLWNEGCKAGTKMHETFEVLSNLRAYELANNLPPKLLTNYYNKFDNPTAEGYIFEIICERLHINCGHCVFYRSEMRMFYDLLNIAGTADTVLYDTKRGGYILTDFKRLGKGLEFPPANPRKNVRDMAPSSRGTLLPFFENQRNINSVRYGVQLSIYKRLFELTNPDKKVIGLILIVINTPKIGQPDPVDFFEVPIDQYSRGVDEMLSLRAKTILQHIVHDTEFDEKYKHVYEKLEALCIEQESGVQASHIKATRTREQNERHARQKDQFEREARRQKLDELDEKLLNGE
jgi:hypothetical protein